MAFSLAHLDLLTLFGTTLRAILSPMRDGLRAERLRREVEILRRGAKAC